MHRCFLPLLLTAACGGTTTLAFPEGLEPLAENKADWPSEAGVLEVVTGDNDDEDFSWAHGRGTINATIEEVFAAVTEPEVSVDRREVAGWTVTMDTEPDYEASYTINNEIEDVVSFNYDVAWRHGATGADEAELIDTYGSRWQMTLIEGFQAIEIIRGSIELTVQGEGLVGVEYVEELKSLQRGKDPEVAQAYLEDHFADVLAVVAGEPLPTFDDEE